MKRLSVLLLIILLSLGLAGCGVTIAPEQSSGVLGQELSPGSMRVHFLDVGQGDCMLVQFPNGQNMLVDAGKNDSAETIMDYLEANGIARLDYLVGTHPHEDHIGSLDKVIQEFPVGEILLPKVTASTRTFRDVLEAIADKGMQVTTAKAGVNILEEEGLSVKLLAPLGSSYEDLNNYSAVIKLTYREVSFLLEGDAEAESEKEMLNSGADVRADVLKVGHHGSNTSTSLSFLNMVKPKYAVISLGEGNVYHHPHPTILTKLKNAGAEILRTDERGTIVFTTDGKDIKVETIK
ncbi:MAG: ComEC/Rec2 family competence protein [Desulfotomaculaceae bacterium]|nr:ComEC/Rec2 family competence protein [Desulfotomaculaceae bacterium]